jgi:hypothetical protein
MSQPTQFSNPQDRLVTLYAMAVRLYPQPFREAYGPSLRRTFRDAMDDRTLPRRKLITLVLRDLVTSLAKEHLSMLRDAFGRPALIFNALILAALATGLALALYAIPQQVLRLGADDPQIALADDLAAKLEQGIAPADAVSPASVDIARSLTPFVIAYDDQGHPLASQAQLDGAIPAPPSGVFDYVRQHGQERLSWQPILGTTSNRDQKSALNGGMAPRRYGVRIAAVIQRVKLANGAPGGFVLAGRNMREVEAREEQVRQMAGVTWIGMLGVILVGTVAFGWWTRPRSVPSATRATLKV